MAPVAAGGSALPSFDVVRSCGRPCTRWFRPPRRIGEGSRFSAWDAAVARRRVLGFAPLVSGWARSRTACICGTGPCSRSFADATGLSRWPLLAVRMAGTSATAVASYVLIEQPMSRGVLGRRLPRAGRRHRDGYRRHDFALGLSTTPPPVSAVPPVIHILAGRGGHAAHLQYGRGDLLSLDKSSGNSPMSGGPARVRPRWPPQEAACGPARRSTGASGVRRALLWMGRSGQRLRQPAMHARNFLRFPTSPCTRSPPTGDAVEGRAFNARVDSGWSSG
jgi:hypothetical protein